MVLLLPAPGRADDRDVAPRWNHQIEVAQGRLVGLIAEGDALESDRAPQRRQRRRVWRVGDSWLHVQKLEDTVDRPASPLDLRRQAGQAADRAKDLTHEGCEGEKATDGELSLDDQVGPQPEDDEVC